MHNSTRKKSQNNARPTHTLSAGVVVVRFIDGVAHYLLLRAWDYWDFPKGEVGPGEAPLQAAVREVREETTLDELRFRWGEACTETEPYARKKVARYYVAEAPEGAVSLPVSAELGRAEHHEFRWLTREAACPLLVERVRLVLDWAATCIGDRED